MKANSAVHVCGRNLDDLWLIHDGHPRCKNNVPKGPCELSAHEGEGVWLYSQEEVLRRSFRTYVKRIADDSQNRETWSHDGVQSDLQVDAPLPNQRRLSASWSDRT